MGNRQASEAVVIQHPGGRVERLYWQTSAAEVMKNNPGYHVALVTLCVAAEQQELLMLSQVMVAPRAKKYEKLKKRQDELIRKQ